jgi:small subunit ribosomal protein S6
VDKYEITFIVEETSKPDSVLKIFEKNSIEKGPLKDLGVRKLAYKIEKLASGHYYSFPFSSDAPQISGLEKELNLNKESIRHLIVRVRHERMKALNAEKQAGRNMARAEAAMAEKAAARVAKDTAVRAEIKTAKSDEAAKVKPPVETATEEKAKPAKAKKAVKTEKPVAVAEPEVKIKKAVRKPKAVKIAAEELDKKLEELIED